MDWIEILKQGGSFAVAGLSIAALIVLWVQYKAQEKDHKALLTSWSKTSAERHKERDSSYEILLRETTACITKNNTLLEIRGME